MFRTEDADAEVIGIRRLLNPKEEIWSLKGGTQTACYESSQPTSRGDGRISRRRTVIWKQGEEVVQKGRRMGDNVWSSWENGQDEHWNEPPDLTNADWWGEQRVWVEVGPEGKKQGVGEDETRGTLLALMWTATRLSLKSVSRLAFWQHFNYAFSSDNWASLEMFHIFKVIKLALNKMQN